MFKFILLIALSLVGTPAVAAQEANKVYCVKRYHEVQQYLSKAQGHLWHLFDTGVINYDEFSFVRNQTVLHTRARLSDVRRLTYGGEPEECEYQAQLAINAVDILMTPYKRK